MRTLRRAVVPGVLVMLFVAPACVHPARAEGRQSLRLDLGIGSNYDDNILSLADHQIRDFESGLHPLRYSIHSVGDGVAEPSIALTWELDQGRGRSHALRLRGGGRYHFRNGTADDAEFSVRWTESFRRGRRLSVGYYRLNDYYFRQLRDEDLPALLGDLRYRRVSFDLQIVSGTWQQRLGRGKQVSLAYQHEKRDYVPEFRERTSGTHQGEIGLTWTRLPRRGRVELLAGYRDSNAEGVDGDEVGGVRDDDDLSYHGFEGGLAGRMEFRRVGSWRWGGDLAYELGTRAYDSPLVTDRYHYGRHDVANAGEVGLRLGYRPHWTLRAWYRLEHNVATLGTSAPPGSDSGSYHVNQVGLAVSWSGAIWHRTEVEEPTEGD